MIKNDIIKKWINSDELFLVLMKSSRCSKDNKKYNKEEHELLEKYITNKTTNQWSNNLGETIVKNILLELKLPVKKPKKKNGFIPDLETNDTIYEVKTRNYTTSGTAGEKILGCPLKYIDVPKIFNKPLKIVLVAYQEYEAINNFKLFDKEMSSEKKEILDLYKKFNIEFVKCSDLLKSIKNN
jgi:hypothetical protein